VSVTSSVVDYQYEHGEFLFWFSDPHLSFKTSLTWFRVELILLKYRYAGRRYHSYSQGNYPMPNDETEQDRCVGIEHYGIES